MGSANSSNMSKKEAEKRIDSGIDSATDSIKSGVRQTEQAITKEGKKLKKGVHELSNRITKEGLRLERKAEDLIETGTNKAKKQIDVVSKKADAVAKDLDFDLNKDEKRLLRECESKGLIRSALPGAAAGMVLAFVVQTRRRRKPLLPMIVLGMAGFFLGQSLYTPKCIKQIEKARADSQYVKELVVGNA